MADFLDEFIKELLHTDDVRANRLLHSGLEGESIKSYRLFAESGETCEKMLSEIKRARGKVSNRTVLKDSAQVRTGVDNPGVEKWLWKDMSGLSDAKALDKFVAEAYNVINLKGNNPLFLGLGSLEWEIAVSDEMRTVRSPILIFPIKLIRGTATSNVEIEFVDDDVYFNPVLYEKLKRTLTEYVYANFPHPNGQYADFDEPVDIDNLTASYFESVAAHIAKCASGNKGTFSFDENYICIAQYNHSDMCMYYDVKRNRKKIEANVLIRSIFGGQSQKEDIDEGAGEARFILPKDSVQEEVVRRILRGQSLIVKGPPGTGKTLTISNIISALLARGKKVLFASKKLAALSEVNAKLPEKLRKFVMLLDFETEQKAAAVNPVEVKKRFKDLIQSVKQYHFDSNVSAEYEKAMREQANSVLELNDYFKELFESGYYEAADTYFKSDLSPVPFADCAEAAKLTRVEYGQLTSLVEGASKHYERLAKGGKVIESPWYGVNGCSDTEAAFVQNLGICRGIEQIFTYLKPIGYEIFANFALGDLYEINENVLSSDDILKVYRCIEAKRAPIDGAIARLRSARENLPLAEFEFDDKCKEKCFEELMSKKFDFKLTRKQTELLRDNRGLFIVDGKLALSKEFLDTICAASEKIDGLEDNIAKKNVEFLSVLDKLDESQGQNALKAYKAFAPYIENGASKPKLFDFTAKKFYKSLRAFSSRSNPSFKDITGAIAAFKETCDSRDEIMTLKSVISGAFGNVLKWDGFKAISLIAKKCRNNVEEYLNAAYIGGNLLNVCLKHAKAPDDFVIEDLIFARKAYVAQCELEQKCAEVCKLCGIENYTDFEKTAKSVSVILKLRDGNTFDGAEHAAEFFDKIKSLDSGFTQTVWDTAKLMREFGIKCFETSFTKNPWLVTVARLERFLDESLDRSMLSAALGYESIKYAKHTLSLESFFNAVETDFCELESARLTELFEHSYYKLLLDYKLASLGRKRNGLGKNAELNLDKFEKSESALLKCNVDVTEKLCISRIDPEDRDFDFLDADRGAQMSLRYLFKTHPDAILKLKPCMIMSPSTASVLLRPDEYFDFDVAIIDEASQLEPVNLLPVLVRSKQCVLVGDEFQMPPLSHFKAKNAKRIEDADSELVIDTDISALSLALHNSAFETYELACHYRSNTESLIAFSQREFYPYMRTFPAAEPFKDGLGFEDVLTSDGCCDGGVNEVEAKKVVEKLEEHFKKYYDSSEGKLTKPVGVVAFGEAQLSYITRLVEENAALTEKIRTATSNFDDLPDKLVFFRTIESVQGQETDTLILSLTYGRDKNGNIKLAFGELNRDLLGKNIFNVAVTRAKSKICVIHSVTASEISENPRISFIKDYLLLVEQFSKDGKSQFVQSVPDYGKYFTADVIDFLVENGIAEERIVQNYGVTDGSVKIPIAVLSKDLNRAELGIWCEYPVLKKYDYLDYNVRYFRSLADRGWNLHRIFIHEWLDNGKFEKAELLKAIKDINN